MYIYVKQLVFWYWLRVFMCTT